MARKGTKIRIGPYSFRQRWVPTKVLDDMGADAVCVWAPSREILLADVCDHERAVENLAHEVIEAINMVSELNLPHIKITALGCGVAQGLGHLIRKWW